MKVRPDDTVRVVGSRGTAKIRAILSNVNGALLEKKLSIDLDPTGFGFELNYGLTLCRVGRREDGVTELREVLRLDPEDAVAAKAIYISNEHVTNAQAANTVAPPKSNGKN